MDALEMDGRFIILHLKTPAMNTQQKATRSIRTLLTYEQCNEESIDELLEFYKVIFNNKIENILVFTTKNNIDKEIKCNVYIKFNKRTRVNNNNLVYRGIKPNIEKITRKEENLIEYKLIKKKLIN